MSWFRNKKETREAVEHKKEIAEVTDRLDAVEKRVDVIADQVAVLERNGDEA